jgi:ADP-heptose:LPS heptosyltransferase
MVRSDSAGDVLLMGPAVRAVAAGAGRVTFLCGPRGAEAAALLPCVDEVIVQHVPWIDATPQPVDRAEIYALVDRLAALQIDQAFVLTSFHQSPLPMALVLRLAGVACIAATSVDYPGSLLDVRHRVSGTIHEVERALSLVETLGYRLAPGDNSALAVRQDAAASVPPVEPPYVVVHPGASVPARTWSVRAHAEVVDLLVGAGRRVVVTGTAGEAALAARVAGPPRPEVADLSGQVDLAGLAAVLAAADAVVVGNTGPAHLAAAVGTPVVSLFAPTVPAVRWRPWRVPQVLLGDQAIGCAGCRARECPVQGHPCLGSVTPQDVVAAVQRLAPPASTAPSTRERNRRHTPHPHVWEQRRGGRTWTSSKNA